MLALPSLDEAAEDLKGLASYDGEHLQPCSHADAWLEMAVGIAAMMVSTCSMAARRLRPLVGMASYDTQLMQPTSNQLVSCPVALQHVCHCYKHARRFLRCACYLMQTALLWQGARALAAYCGACHLLLD